MTEELHHIIQGCKNNNPAQQRKLFELFASDMMYVCQRYTQNTAEAEDILQEAFVRAFQKIHQLDLEKGNVGGWLRRIVINCAIGNWRKHHKNSVYQSMEYVPEQEIAPYIETELEANEILKLIDALPEGYRMVFNLNAIEGYHHAEIAELLQITESTSRSQLARARAMLQQSIHELYHKIRV